MALKASNRGKNLLYHFYIIFWATEIQPNRLKLKPIIVYVFMHNC